jgi:polyhydroxyalkanoate synthesis regulator phasin
LVLATLAYNLDKTVRQMNNVNFDATKHYTELKLQTEEHFQKGRLTKLKQWFRDLTEMHVETRDFSFNTYLQDKTKYDTDIFKAFFQRVDKVIKKGKITTDNQFHDINIMLDQLSREKTADNQKKERLARLLSQYEQQKSKNS